MEKINPAKSINELISVLAYISDMEKRRKTYHSWRVAILSVSLAKTILSPQKIKEIFYASMMMDIGGVGLSRHITHYLKRSDKESRNILLSHPIIGAQLISHMPNMNMVSRLILDHHEWINGQGYPRAKTQKLISLGAQIIRIADAIDTALQGNNISKLQELQRKLSLTVDKEYTNKLFARAVALLKRDRFFYKIIQLRNIPELFEQIKSEVGNLSIPLKVDAIGTSLEVIAQIVDMRHPYTSGHSLRVSRYAMACALALDFDHDAITRIKWGGLIHDIGKLSVSRKVLDKPSPLTPKEFKEIKKHALLGKKIIGMIPSLKHLTAAVINHHERFDGTGYPTGLKGTDIPLDARILTICDAFDTMTSNRPYRRTLTTENACLEIKRSAGTQFDPEIVDKTIVIFKNLSL